MFINLWGGTSFTLWRGGWRVLRLSRPLHAYFVLLAGRKTKRRTKTLCGRLAGLQTVLRAAGGCIVVNGGGVYVANRGDVVSVPDTLAGVLSIGHRQKPTFSDNTTARFVERHRGAYISGKIIY